MRTVGRVIRHAAWIGLTLVLVVAVNGLALSAPFATTDPPSKQQYVFVNYVAGAEVWGPVYQAFDEAAKMLGVKLTRKGPIEFDVAAQVRILDELVALRPDGVIVATADPESPRDAINRLMDAGIPVITFDTDSPDSKRLTYIGIDSFQNGYEAGLFLGQYLTAKYGKTKTIEVGFSGIVGNYNCEERRRGYLKAFSSRFPNIKEAAYVDDQSDVVRAINVQRDMLTAHPNIKAIIALDGLAGPSAVRALRETGKTGQVAVMAFDYNKDTLEYIKRGSILATVANKGHRLGPFYALHLLYWLVNDKVQIAPGWRSAGLSLVPTPNWIDTGVSIVTQDSVDLLIKLLSK